MRMFCLRRCHESRENWLSFLASLITTRNPNEYKIFSSQKYFEGKKLYLKGNSLFTLISFSVCKIQQMWVIKGARKKRWHNNYALLMPYCLKWETCRKKKKLISRLQKWVDLTFDNKFNEGQFSIGKLPSSSSKSCFWQIDFKSLNIPGIW